MSKSLKCTLTMTLSHFTLSLMLLCLWPRDFCSSGIFPAFPSSLSLPFVVLFSLSVFSLDHVEVLPLTVRLTSRVQYAVPFPYVLTVSSSAGVGCGSIPSCRFIRGPAKRRSIPQAISLRVLGSGELSACGHLVFSRFQDRRTPATRKWRMRPKVVCHLGRSQFGWMKKMKTRKCKLPNFSSRVRLDTLKVTYRFEKKSSLRNVMVRRCEKYWKVQEGKDRSESCHRGRTTGNIFAYCSPFLFSSLLCCLGLSLPSDWASS